MLDHEGFKLNQLLFVPNYKVQVYGLIRNKSKSVHINSVYTMYQTSPKVYIQIVYTQNQDL